MSRATLSESLTELSDLIDKIVPITEIEKDTINAAIAKADHHAKSYKRMKESADMLQRVKTKVAENSSGIKEYRLVMEGAVQLLKANPFILMLDVKTYTHSNEDGTMEYLVETEYPEYNVCTMGDDDDSFDDEPRITFRFTATRD
jgi:hypothetical protein